MTCFACKILPALVLALTVTSVRGSLEEESCEGSSGQGGGAGLLQALHAHKDAPGKSAGGEARSMLSSAMFEMGMELLKNEQTLDTFVTNTFGTSFDFPWTTGSSIQMRTVTGDASPAFDPGEDYYGLASFGDAAPEEHVMNMSTTAAPEAVPESFHRRRVIQKVDANAAPTEAPPKPKPKQTLMNMLDVGGNIGLITIGAWKRFPDKMRIVVVEPSPSTYLLLRWNLELNGIPTMSFSEFQGDLDKPGVLALNNGVGNVDGQTFGLCYTPPLTQNAVLCECTADDAARAPQMGVQQCHNIVSYALPSLFNLFFGAPITFIKMDCEGCEKSLLPSLSNVTGTKIARFSGELHSVANEFEDIACNFDEGQWFIHVCFQHGKYDVVWLKERCMQGSKRPSCVNPNA